VDYLLSAKHQAGYLSSNFFKVRSIRLSLIISKCYLCYSRLVAMDVSIPREEINKADEDDSIFMMDEDPRANTAMSLEHINIIAHTLDICLDKVFNYVYSECHEPGTNQLDWTKTKSLYQDILTAFDKIILPTYNTHHVQFIMFVLCSFKSTLVEAFLNYLWKKVCNPNIASVTRQAAVNYIVSFVARATFVPVP
jgi:RNA polymerase I-specific transcription initiation factor RRN3